MEPEVIISSPKSKKRNILLIIMSAFILLMLATASVFGFMTLQSSKVYKGVSVGSLDVSGMKLQELKSYIDSKYQPAADTLEITLETDKVELKATYTELNAKYDTEAAAQNAFAVGRSGNIFKRFYEIAMAGTKGTSFDVPLSVDEDKLNSFVDNFYDKTLVTVKEGSLLITDTNVTIHSGTHGENIDKAKTLELLKSLINEQKSGIIQPEVIITAPTKFNVDELYAQLNTEPVDASYVVENSALTLIPHKVGRKVDKSELEKITAELENAEDVERPIPVTITVPAVTTENAASMLFKDELASASTYFGTGTENGRNRGFNINLAASKINNMILAPGDEFSFNKVVGPRDVEHGFKVAHVYSAGKIIDGIGGGICQVSSTMYNAVLKADLKVSERRNHSFTVGYVPLGQDATAYYGGVDFKFVNSTKWPVKLLAKVKGNKIYFSMLGTNETPSKTVIISGKVLKETPYQVVYIDDPTMPAGTTKEKVEGLNGYVVETYKTIKIDGKVVSETKLHTSTYKAYAQQLLRGTKPVAGTTTSGAATPVKPVETTSPADGEILDEAPPVDEAPPAENAPSADNVNDTPAN